MPNESNLNQFYFQRHRLFILAAAFLFGIFAVQKSFAHQQPTTLVFLDVTADKVAMELEIPLTELELAFGNGVSQNADTLIERLEPQLKEYLLAHIRPKTAANQPWTVAVKEMKLGEAEQTQSGKYQEIKINLDLLPPPHADTRNFILDYDVIIHQVVSHKAFVSIRNDWETGVIGSEQPVEAGVIMVDTATTKIYPLEINLNEGSWKTGFTKMLSLGMHHIREGTDHLLFLLVLLLPAPLLVKNNRWEDFGGTKYSITRLLKIVTAFTVGHSLTLLVGALNFLQFPAQPIEVLIAVSILVSAAHAVRPIFPGREMYVAAGFGLIHGLAFATVLSGLNLSAGQMALSILGFNLGIELMQIFVIALVMPWLIIISLTPYYKWVRIGGAILAAIAAVAWIVERVSGEPNRVSTAVQNAAEYAHLSLLALAFVALAAFGLKYLKDKNHSAETQP